MNLKIFIWINANAKLLRIWWFFGDCRTVPFLSIFIKKKARNNKKNHESLFIELCADSNFWRFWYAFFLSILVCVSKVNLVKSQKASRNIHMKKQFNTPPPSPPCKLGFMAVLLTSIPWPFSWLDSWFRKKLVRPSVSQNLTFSIIYI